MEAKCSKRCFRVGKKAFNITLFSLLTFLERHLSRHTQLYDFDLVYYDVCNNRDIGYWLRFL
jgi:hypothetical protein